MMAGSVREILSLDWDALRALGECAERGRLQDGDLALVSQLVRTVSEFAALLSQIIRRPGVVTVSVQELPVVIRISAPEIGGLPSANRFAPPRR